MAVAVDGNVAALVELKSETDFVAKSPQFVNLVNELAQAVAEGGEGAVDTHKDAIDDLKLTLKENIEIGRVVRFVAESGHVLDTYLHVQNGRGRQRRARRAGRGHARAGPRHRRPHRLRPAGYLQPRRVPADDVAAERAALEAQTRNEGKPEQALPKIVEGKLNGWYKRVPGGVLLEQPYAKDDKQTVAQVLGGARVVRFAQAVVGG